MSVYLSESKIFTPILTEKVVSNRQSLEIFIFVKNTGIGIALTRLENKVSFNIIYYKPLNFTTDTNSHFLENNINFNSNFSKT
jgi:hypothetical protein